MEAIDQYTAAQLGGFRLRQFVQRPTIGTRGGILLLWDDAVVQATDVSIGVSLSATIKIINSDVSYKLTTVYGPTRGNLKDAFFAELVATKPCPGTRWLVIGDFNQIYHARDKNRSNANHSRIVRFHSALGNCVLKEIHLSKTKILCGAMSNKTRR
jgi:hypothetical protein